MAEQNISTFTNSMAITGLLLFSLIAFAGIFFAANNPNGITLEDNNILNSTQSDLSSNIIAIEDDSNSILTVASNTNPTESQLGSRDSVSTSFSMFGSGKRFINSSKLLISWIFAGEVGRMLLSIFIGLIGLSATYLIYRAIRGY